MTREDKAIIIDELSKKFSENNYFYITDSSGLSVAQINDLRRICFNKGVEYKVFKNTLIKKALEKSETDYSEFNKIVLKGFSGVMFAETGNLPAKILKEFRKASSTDRPALKGASVDSSFYYGEESFEALFNLKSKFEVIGDIVGALQAPAKNVVSALQSGKNTLAGLVKTLSERD
jgi:large subunit ribosomal protein L10